MTRGLLGQIVTPATRNRLQPGADWIADNGCFGTGYPGDTAYLTWLASYPPAGCRFAVAPDVVSDAAATLARSAPMLAPIRHLGVPVAYVAQNGATVDTLPWDQFDALFLGGCTAWKLGPDARTLAAEARRRGLWVHMGRVNSLRRLRYAAAIGCDSADGTYLAFGPDRNLTRLLDWLRLVDEPGLWEIAAGAPP
jgi:hypothetical protein